MLQRRTLRWLWDRPTHGRPSVGTENTVPPPPERTPDIRAFHDALAEGEIDRLAKDTPGRVNFEVHRRFLESYARPGDRVLEIGAGPGRFTVELARLGATVVVTDISPVQLDVNARYVAEAGAEDAVEGRRVLDITDTSAFADDTFDIVLAYGGPLSYVFGHEQQAMTGMLRITKPEGVVLASVMSLWGTWRARLDRAVALADEYGDDVAIKVLETGDLRHVPGMEHVCQMFTWQQVVDLVERSGGAVLAGAASNWASLSDSDALTKLESAPDRWRRFLDFEIDACRSDGTKDGGTHILFAARRNDTGPQPKFAVAHLDCSNESAATPGQRGYHQPDATDAESPTND